MREPTLRELTALDGLMRQLEAIRKQFQAERLSQHRDAAERDARRLGQDPFVLDTGAAIVDGPDTRLARRRAGRPHAAGPSSIRQRFG